MKPMKNTGLLFLFLLFWGSVWAQNSNELSTLRLKASQMKNLDSYSAVCKHLYETEESSELLLIYADSLLLLGIRDKSLDCFLEGYSWSGEASFMKGNFTDGFLWKQKALLLAEKAQRVKDALIICSDMGYYYNVSARYDSARYYFRKGMQMIERNSMKVDERYRTMLTNYASSFLFEGKVDSALIYMLKAEKQSILDKDTAMLIENLNQLGTIYRRKKNLDSCILNFEKALHLCEAQQNFKIATYIYGNIATAYCDWDRPKDAIPFSEKAVEYALKIGTPQMLGICYVNLGSIQSNVVELRTKGIATLQKAIPLLVEVNNQRRLCEVYSYLVNVYRQKGDLTSALVYLNKLDKAVHELKTDVEFYRYYKSKAPLLQANGEYTEAVKYYLKMTDMLQKGYRDTRDYEHYFRLSECYKALNNDVKAYNNLLKAYGLRDSSFRLQYTEQLSDFSVKYKTKEKELEITQLRQKELEHKAELLHRRILHGSIITVLLVVLLGLLYSRQRQKTRLAELARASGEKERQFLTLQKETEERLTRKYIDGLESERERMATELHDDVCNNLLALEMNFRLLPEGGGMKKDQQLKLLGEARERLRNISHELMPPAFQYATIDEMLTDYVIHLVLPESMQVNYESTEMIDWKLVSQEIGFEFYRIVQEAVSNAAKYSEAAHVRVCLTLDDKRLSVLISDDGKGFDPNRKTKGIGLHTIYQRAHVIGGQIKLDTALGNGVRIEVSILI